MLRTWLVWGVLPLAAALVVTMLVSALVGTDSAATAMHLERRFQVILAVAAGLFLIAFSLDSKWTSHHKLAVRIARAAGLDPVAAAEAQLAAAAAPTQEGKRRKRSEAPSLSPLQPQLAAQAKLVFDSVLSSTCALTVTGAAIAVCAVLAAAARLGLTYSLMLLILAGSYQLFVFSRHAYYRDLLDVAAAGQLVVHLEQKKETGWARVLRILGWR